MKLLAISEHYFPRVGGTVNYLHETLSALVRQGVHVELWVPGPAPEGWLPYGLAVPTYKIVWINAGYPPQRDPSREERYRFCHEANKAALARAKGVDAPDLLHVMFGLFLMEVLDTNALRAVGLPSVVTVHNVPPQECGLVAPSSSLCQRLREGVRLKVVGWKNRARLRAHRYDAVLVPSDQVRELLTAVLKMDEIEVIGHGPTGELLRRMVPPDTRRPAKGSSVRLLTAGGYAPHKRQHIIPDVAARLTEIGVDFVWDVVGPPGRIAGYYDSVRAAVTAAGLDDVVRLRAAAPFAELAELYDAAHLYVQPSVEEGFCITALDAAAAGLPVIASPAGALARITRASGGSLVESKPSALANAIAEFVAHDRWGNSLAQAKSVQEEFSWHRAARVLRTRYASLATGAAHA